MSNLHLKIHFRNKAKEDIDIFAEAKGFKNVATGSEWKGTVGRFFSKLLSLLMLVFRARKGDVLLIQYPFKKYYPSLCRIMRWKGGKTITLIHDLGCFRRKKLTVEEEIVKLSRTDVLIVHNESMMRFLKDNGYRKPMLTLDIFDYVSGVEPASRPTHQAGAAWDIVYAGGLAMRKNKFLYILDDKLPDNCNWKLYIHGSGLDEAKAAGWAHIKPLGYIKSDDFIKESVGHFGLVWDGASIDGCSGDWGEYLKINNPHKTSFYLRSGKPVIIWQEAALAPFVESEGVGIVIGSLTELHERLACLTEEEYEKMVGRVQLMRQRLATGYYFNKAFDKAIALL